MIVGSGNPTDPYVSLRTVPTASPAGEASQVLLVHWWLSLFEAYRVTSKPRLRPPKANRTR